MKISEIKGERALEVIADLIDPISEMLKDEEFKSIVKGDDRAKAVKYLLKSHKKNVLIILALINGENPETYEPTLVSLPMMLMDLLNDPDIAMLFGLRSQNTELASFGSAMENIEAPEE